MFEGYSFSRTIIVMLSGRIGLAVCCFLLPAFAAAEAQFTADDIIAHFAKQNEIAAKPAETESSGVVVNGRTGKKLNFQGTTDNSSSGAQTVLSDGLVIPMTGAKRNITIGAAAAGPSVVAAAPSPMPGASGYDLSVTFELSSDRLTPQARTNLRQFAIALQTPALAGYKFAVEGHTDATGAEDKNLELSERRAASVVAFLTGLGVQENRLSARGYGETQPLLSDPDDPGNRRVETRRIE